MRVKIYALLSLMLQAGVLCAQDMPQPSDAAPATQTTATQVTATPATASESAAENERIDYGEGTAAIENGSEFSATSQIFLLLRTIVVLVLVAAAVYGLVFFLKRQDAALSAASPYLKVVSRAPLTQKASCAIVAIGDKAYILGVTDENVALITEVVDKEIVDEMLLDIAKRESASKSRAVSFQALLAKLLPKHEQKQPSEDSAAKLKKHAERLRRLG